MSFKARASYTPVKRRYRNERKFFISTGDAIITKQKMMALTTIDKHARAKGSYFIRSLYFDDYFDMAYVDKDRGVVDRKKYRIRIYNCSDAVINLERKKKYGDYIFKQSAKITRQEFEDIIDEKYDFLLTKEHELLREFYYECTANVMRPKVIVDYTRIPFVDDNGGTVRITLDLNLSVSKTSWNIFDKTLPTMPAIDKQMHILEVKFTEFYPNKYTQVFHGLNVQGTAASKYVMCRDAIEMQRERQYASTYQPSYLVHEEGGGYLV